MSKRTGGAAVVRALEDEGVPLTFGIPGTHNIELYDALSESDAVRPALVTDEQGASFMADAVWRASGRLGCVNLVPGAGLTHALSGIAEAWMDTVPMLVLACGVRGDSGRAYQLHDIDQLAVARPVTKAQLRPENGEEIYGAVRRACRIARTGRPGPVIVEIPAEHYLFRHEAPDGEPAGGEGRTSFPLAGEGGATRRGDAGPGGGEGSDRDPPGAPRPPEAPRPSVVADPDPPAPDREAVDRAAELLGDADRPLLYVGLGAAGAADLLPELAERLEAPVSTTFQGKGVFPESHPLWLWPGFGETAPDFVASEADRRDATLAIGCRFSEVGTGSWSFEPPGPLVHVDVDEEVFDANFEAALVVRADARRFVEALLERLPERPRGPDPELRERIADGHARVREAQLASTDADRVTPTRLLRELQRTFGPEAVFTTDSGNGTFLALEGLRLEEPGKLLAPIDYSCMGYSVPAAVGAKLARPDLPVLALAGDGAFLMTGLELLTAAREGAAVGILVLRDRELAQISQFQDVALNRRTASELAPYDLADLARGVGAESLAIRDDGEIADAVEELAHLLEGDRPVLVDVAIDYSRKTWFTEGVVKTTLGRLPVGEKARFVGRALWRRLTG